MISYLTFFHLPPILVSILVIGDEPLRSPVVVGSWLYLLLNLLPVSCLRRGRYTPEDLGRWLSTPLQRHHQEPLYTRQSTGGWVHSVGLLAYRRARWMSLAQSWIVVLWMYLHLNQDIASVWVSVPVTLMLGSILCQSWLAYPSTTPCFGIALFTVINLGMVMFFILCP